MDKGRGERTGALGDFFARVSEKRGVGRGRILLDVAACAVGFLFGGRHLIFGAYPLGISLVAALPSSVWASLLGAVAGSILRGGEGVAFALVSVLCVLIRVIISGQDKRRGAFSESILLRISSALLSGLVLAIYEILLRGFSLTTLLFGLFMALCPVLLVPLFACLFVQGITPRRVLFGDNVPLFSHSAVGRERFDMIAFRISAVGYIFFISLSLDTYRIFGVDTSLIFAACVAILLGKRFGALFGAIGGFIASVGISPLYSVAFMLFGAVSGALFQFSSLVALALGASALSLFSGYAGGVTGLLSVLPECLIGSVAAYPMLKRLSGEVGQTPVKDNKRLAADMVGTMTMSYRLRVRLSDDNLPLAVSELSALTRELLGTRPWLGAGELTLLSTVMKDSRDYSLSLREIDDALTDRLEELFCERGFKDSVVRVFGDEEKYILAAAHDESGERIADRTLKEKIEELTDSCFREPRFYRRGGMALMEMAQAPKFKIECQRATLAGNGGEVSGDTVSTVQCEDGRFFAIISDGMGSGNQARATSELAVRFFETMLRTHATEASLVHLLNGILRGSDEECPVTLDLFSVNTYSGKASFLKAGAVCSYIRRGDSLFRIKSETMPVGVLSRVEAETVAAEVMADDIIVMMSDGVSGECDDAPWLIDLLHRDIVTLSSLAEMIIDGARENNATRDDMSVLVLRISSI